MKNRLLVTGGDGFLGSHVVREALKDGYTVRAFIQPGRNLDVLDGLPVERFEGDLLDKDDIKSALQDCQMLIHTAGTTAVFPSQASWIWEINYHAVVDLAQAAREAGITRFVHISSACTFGYGSKESPGDEDSPYLGAKFHLDYMDSKRKAQEYLLDEYKHNELPVIIINPTYMIGEYDTKPGSGQMVIAAAKHQVPGFTEGGKCVVYVGDVARAAVNALKMGRAGECYITGGQNLSYQEFFALITHIAGTRDLAIKIPRQLAVLSGFLLEQAAKLSGKPPRLTAVMARMSSDGHYYTSSKALRELALPQTTPEVAIQKAIEYFRKIGYL